MNFYSRALCVLLFSLYFVPSAVAASRHGVAVIIGNKNYGNNLPSVNFAHNDAEAIESYIRSQLGITEIIHVRDATKGRMDMLFGSKDNLRGELAGRVRPGESDVVVFYSGHGMPGLTDGEAYMVPVDGIPNYIELGGYSLDLLYDNLKKIGAYSVLVLIDACFSGTSENGSLIKEASALGLKAKMPKSALRFTILTATQGNQMARWDRKEQRGLFTSYLLRGLSGEADEDDDGNGDGKITLSEMKRYLDREMTRRARIDFNQNQKAYIDGQGDVVLANYNVDLKREREAKELATKKEWDLWVSAIESGDERRFRSYLQQYPVGAFVKEARRLLVMIEKNISIAAEIEQIKKVPPQRRSPAVHLPPP